MNPTNCAKTIYAIFVTCGLLAGAASAQTYTTLASFGGINGSNPIYGSLIQGADGNFYGTTERGGVGPCSFVGNSGCGTIFRVSPAGTLQRIYSFCPVGDCTVGELPLSGLLLSSNGNAYGTTWYGGSTGYPCEVGCGNIYKISRGTIATFYNFCAQPECADGGQPYPALIEGSDGNFYGTTSLYGLFSGGTVFKITPAGNLSTLYSFCQSVGCTDGEYPNAGVIEGTDGNFYGTTYYGGANGWGSVFRLTPKGTLTTLHSFAGTPTEGGYPSAGLVEGTDGSFYGTTLHGGVSTCFEGCGTVFRITSNGAFKTLHTFTGPEGDDPTAGLIQGTDGNFYGTTAGGGANDGGTIFKISAAGTLDVLYNFCALPDCADGVSAWGNLLQATDGSFYGATYGGGENPSCPDCGTVFSLNAGLAPFVTFVHNAGRIGQTADILGQGLTGATAVLLNGTPANFTVVSDTSIRANVPSGATTGLATVATPSGTLTSNVPFYVIP